MIVVDANLLLYAYNSEDARHEAARLWFERALSGPDQVRLAWVTILAFLRIGTNPRAFERPLALIEAVGHVSAWFERPTVAPLEPGERHWQILAALLPAAQARANLVTDAHLAALAIEHGATLCTTDKDFTRFRGLKVRYPLESD